VKAYRLLLCLHDILIPCVFQSFLSFILLYLTGKLDWKILKKVHRNELNTWLESISVWRDSRFFFFNRVWKFMSVSFSINLILCFKANLFIVAYIYLIVRIWAWWSDRPFIMGGVEDQFILLLYTNILSVAVLKLFWILVAKLTVCDRLYVVNEAGFFFSVAFSEMICVYVSTN